MAYDETLAKRIRKTLGRKQRVTEKKMFGGLAFMLGGKMFCGIIGDDLMVRVGPDGHDDALTQPHVRPMDFTGRPMRGYVYVAPPACRTDAELAGHPRRHLRRNVEEAEQTPLTALSLCCGRPRCRGACS
jgi:hypothetical protein